MGLRLVRVVRVLRVLKVLHMIPFFRRLGLMMTSVMASLSALAPAFVLLILVMYLHGICIMQGITSYLAKSDPPSRTAHVGVFEDRFRTLPSTMITLFSSVTSGLSWVECLDALSMIGGIYQYIFLFYVAFVSICVLNIVTGVFVDTVHQMYQPEREEMIQQEPAKRKKMLQKLRDLLEEADEDGSGSITWGEFQDFASDDEIKMYLASLDIDVVSAREIFELLDPLGTGEVSIDELVIGFLEMKGAAKGADVAILRNNVQKLQAKLSFHAEVTRKDLNEIKGFHRCQDAQDTIDPLHKGRLTFASPM